MSPYRLLHGPSRSTLLKTITAPTLPTKQLSIALLFVLIPLHFARGWGFEAHKQINRHAVFTLPPAMFGFYKYHIQFLTDNAVNPDKRRYSIPEEAPRHYIDLDYYKANTPHEVPQQWSQAEALYTESTRMDHGILPWYIILVKHRLTNAFERKDVAQILRLSADIGHYIADANVPLHTTENYNGQFTDQVGIHGLWETRIPALCLQDYNLFVGQATYVQDPQQSTWEAILTAHQAVDSVLKQEKDLSERFPAMEKYCYEQRGSTLHKEYAEAYARTYHNMLDGQVERQLRASIKMVGDFWFTCWVDAGQPDLEQLLEQTGPEAHPEETLPINTKRLKVRCCGEEHAPKHTDDA